MSDPKAEEAFNEALKSSEVQARVEQNKTAIDNAAKEIDALLTDVVSPPVRDSLVHAFSRSSTLLVARAALNQSWWRRVFAEAPRSKASDMRSVRREISLLSAKQGI